MIDIEAEYSREEYEARQDHLDTIRDGAKTAERDAVVKYLRYVSGTISEAFYARVVSDVADEIEKGEHLK